MIQFVFCRPIILTFHIVVIKTSCFTLWSANQLFHIVISKPAVSHCDQQTNVDTRRWAGITDLWHTLIAVPVAIRNILHFGLHTNNINSNSNSHYYFFQIKKHWHMYILTNNDIHFPAHSCPISCSKTQIQTHTHTHMLSPSLCVSHGGDCGADKMSKSRN